MASIFFSSALVFLETSGLAAEASGSRTNTASRWIRAARAGRMTLTSVAGFGQQSTGLDFAPFRKHYNPLMRPAFQWRLRSRNLDLGKRTLIMGVVNVTPDSFYDGGRYFSPKAAADQALKFLDEGADILDIGGESTRPGARTNEGGISEQEELKRVLPVIESIKAQRPGAILSIDTYKSGVARRAAAAGVEIVNDVSACRWDPLMAG